MYIEFQFWIRNVTEGYLQNDLNHTSLKIEEQIVYV